MNNKGLIAFSVLLWISLGGCAVAERNWQHSNTGDIIVRVVDEQGRSLPVYPIKSRKKIRKAYLQAVENERYSIEILNNTSDRIGLVIAVDGRNIISGRYSKLRSNERMYILNPHQSGVYQGWRTAQDNINRFYFTEADRSYAATFGDNSAMGVIAVAAYKEKYAPSQAMNKNKTSPRSLEKRAGTGYGESEYSPSHRVEFRPKRNRLVTHLFKYEWHKQLCRKGIVSCGRENPRHSGNRLWRDEEDFAPQPRWDWH